MTNMIIDCPHAGGVPEMQLYFLVLQNLNRHWIKLNSYIREGAL
jgi:hypothetical protein